MRRRREASAPSSGPPGREEIGAAAEERPVGGADLVTVRLPSGEAREAPGHEDQRVGHVPRHAQVRPRDAVRDGADFGADTPETGRGDGAVEVEAPHLVLGAVSEVLEPAGRGGEGDLGLELGGEGEDFGAFGVGGLVPGEADVGGVAGQGAGGVQQEDEPLGGEVRDVAGVAGDGVRAVVAPEVIEGLLGMGLDARESEVDVHLAELGVVPVGGVLHEPPAAELRDLVPAVGLKAGLEAGEVGGAHEDVGVDGGARGGAEFLGGGRALDVEDVRVGLVRDRLDRCVGEVDAQLDRDGGEVSCGGRCGVAGRGAVRHGPTAPGITHLIRVPVTFPT